MKLNNHKSLKLTKGVGKRKELEENLSAETHRA